MYNGPKSCYIPPWAFHLISNVENPMSIPGSFCHDNLMPSGDPGIVQVIPASLYLDKDQVIMTWYYRDEAACDTAIILGYRWQPCLTPMIYGLVVLWGNVQENWRNRSQPCSYRWPGVYGTRPSCASGLTWCYNDLHQLIYFDFCLMGNMKKWLLNINIVYVSNKAAFCILFMLYCHIWKAR